MKNMADKINYFREGIKNIRTVGTITRSSPFLCRKMAEKIDPSPGLKVAELGAGDGVITHHILNQLPADAQLFAFELLPNMCEYLHKIQDDRLTVVEDSAEQIGAHLKGHNVESLDYILSAIPFVALPNDLGYKIVGECKKILKPGGKFIQIHYSLLAKKLYEDVFGNVRVTFVPWNIPPAFLLTSEKKPD
jgi:phospholipid N-methyltransferase